MKLLLTNESGEILNSVTKEYPLSFPRPGWSEQDPRDWWKAVQHGILELTENFNKDQVRGIGCGGQMHGLVALDEDDRVIRPAILWNDGRTAEETEWLNTVIGKEKLSELTANIAFAGFTAPKLLWMKRHEPENFARIKKIMLPKDYINYRLTGVHSCDYSDASGMLLLDVAHRCWSKEMLEICGISEEQMPKLFESYEVTGTLRGFVSGSLGLPRDCRVVAGAGDNAAAAVGTGVVGEGGCNISLGTSGTIFISSKKFGVDPNNALHAVAHADGVDTGRSDMVQAVLEGVAFAIRDSFEIAKSLGIPIVSSRLCGGGAKSPLWRKILADILNIRLEIPQTEEGGYGAAMLAMVGCGEYKSVEECAGVLTSVSETIEPDPAAAARYETQYLKFKKIYPAMKTLFKEIKEEAL